MAFLAVLLIAGLGCGPTANNRDRRRVDTPDLGPTIGSLAEVAPPGAIPVEGFGLVGNLPGTGSAICPPSVRAYLRSYILTQLPSRAVNVDDLINSNTTAVVMLDGVIPPLASRGDSFDVRVSLIRGSEATSLLGGWLYGAEMRPQGPGGQASRPLATVDGSLYVNLVGTDEPDLISAHLLGAGRVSNDYFAVISLPSADYALASSIRNRLSERYGPDVPRAVSPRAIEYAVPPAYSHRKGRFLAVVAATYMNESPELTAVRADWFVQQLVSGRNAEQSEIALEAIGRGCLSRLAPLLESQNEETRFRAARVMLNLRDDRAVPVLRQIALDPRSAYRAEALETVVASARRTDATLLLRRLLQDRDQQVVLAAYEHLRRLGDASIVQEFVGRSFYLERVVETSHRAIFVSRRGAPRVVIFGAPLRCRDSVFVESPDGTVTIDARPDEGYVSLRRRNPRRQGIIGPVRTGLALSEVIRALGAEPTRDEEGRLLGLGVSYAEVVSLLERLCSSEAVAAEFWLGPAAQFN